MKTTKLLLRLVVLSIIFIFSSCSDDGILMNDLNSEISEKGGKPTDGEAAGNNLSFPVIWSDGVTKVLPGAMEQHSLAGDWYGVWGVDPIDPQADLFSCGPYLGNVDACIEAEFRAYVQKDSRNVWQASNWAPTELINVDFINWGDNLESVDWKITSQVRVEMVLLENTNTYPGENLTQYPMRHAFGWGITEVHGLQTDFNGDIVTDPAILGYTLGTQATVYSDNARFTIQKLNVDEKTDERLNSLQWEPTVGWFGEGENEGLINDPILNSKASAEINVKGKIIYGTTWNVRSTNDGEGYYRLTFSLDPNENLNTAFDAQTQFVEDVVVVDPDAKTALSAKKAPEGDDGGDTGEDSGGGKGEIVFQDGYSLTYIDILITAKTTGKGGGGGTGGGNGGGNGTGSGSGTGGGGSGSGSGSGGSGSGSGSGNH